MNLGISEQKKSIRRTIRERIAAFDFIELMQKSANLQTRFESECFPLLKTVLGNKYALCFSPVSDEPRLHLEYLGVKTAYVRITDWANRAMVASEASREVPGPWEEVEISSNTKIYQPNSECRVLNASEIGIVLVPGLGFDRDGNRLGRGVGFYDRYLPSLPHAKRIGVCFHEQIIESIPTDEFDQKVDAILTDHEWIQTPRFIQS